MRKLPFLFLLTLIACFSSPTKAQDVAKDIPLTPADKRALLALFKDANSRYYRMDYNSGRETYGTRTISAAEMEQVRKARAIDNECIRVNVTNGIIFQFKDGTIIAAFTPATRDKQNPIVYLLGREKATRFASIMAKYVGNEDILGAPDTQP